MAPPRKSHCIRGHERTPENVDSKNGCKICRKELHREGERKRRKTSSYLEYAKKYEQRPERKKKQKEKADKLRADGYFKDWRTKPENRDKENARIRKMRELLAPHYVAQTLKMSVKDCPQELIEVAALKIKLIREVRKCKSKM